MLLLVSGATRTVRDMGLHPNLGRLITPSGGNSISEMADCGLWWGGDNDCFRGLDPDNYFNMLNEIAQVDTSRLLFVTVPDVVADHHVTRGLFDYWYPALEKRELPSAFVAQDGCKKDGIPWNNISALFIGGSTPWKLSKSAALLIRLAKIEGKWVHIGRVNSFRRITYFQSLGADSFDGTQYSRFGDTYIPATLEFLAGPKQSSMLGVQLYA